MPVMVEDYINGSFCHCYIGVNGEVARLPERDKGYIFRFSCSLSCVSLHSKYTHTHQTHTYHKHTQYVYIRVHTNATDTNFHSNKKNLNICCLFEMNCCFVRLSNDVHSVIVKSTSVATPFEVECGSFVQGQMHTQSQLETKAGVLAVL